MSVPPGEHIGQGMGRVMHLAKYSIDCHSGANGQQIGGDYMVIQVGPLGNPLGIRGQMYCALWKKVWGIGGVTRNSGYTPRT